MDFCLLYIGLPSGASSKGAPRGVQDVPYSLEIAGSNPGYVTADRDREFLGGGAQLAERCPGREGLGRQGNPRLTPVADRAPVALQRSRQICVVLRHYRSGGIAVDLQCEKRWLGRDTFRRTRVSVAIS